MVYLELIKTINYMENTVTERFKELIKIKKSSILDFSKQIGIAQTTLNCQLYSTRGISINVILLTLKTFPEISAEWLLRGEGDMIRESPENERDRIGRRIAETRKEKGLSQMQLSELTGITSKNIANIEAGKYNTEIDTLAKIAKALNCKIDFIQK